MTIFVNIYFVGMNYVTSSFSSILNSAFLANKLQDIYFKYISMIFGKFSTRIPEIEMENNHSQLALRNSWNSVMNGILIFL